MGADARYNELEKLAALRERGVLSEFEFNEEKQRILYQADTRKRAGVPMRIFAGLMWTVVFWFCGLFIAGAVAGGMNPENAAEAGRAAGETYSGLILVLALIAAIAGAVTRKLPLTR